MNTRAIALPITRGNRMETIGGRPTSSATKAVA